ncbi:hypothetical protein BDY19DRAFT_905942 [Irpex rosettiformis]|uniref:Uncharacterized protein n=1 Tax=Irpex rosettiformis TaxID=378272 RepID=A0ACB8U635_9APHY|nr:hypothetical protein BDY19DRAFT_905942 [Irpex rosettiformis]
MTYFARTRSVALDTVLPPDCFTRFSCSQLEKHLGRDEYRTLEQAERECVETIRRSTPNRREQLGQIDCVRICAVIHSSTASVYYQPSATIKSRYKVLTDPVDCVRICADFPSSAVCVSFPPNVIGAHRKTALVFCYYRITLSYQLGVRQTCSIQGLGRGCQRQVIPKPEDTPNEFNYHRNARSFGRFPPGEQLVWDKDWTLGA